MSRLAARLICPGCDKLAGEVFDERGDLTLRYRGRTPEPVVEERPVRRDVDEVFSWPCQRCRQAPAMRVRIDRPQLLEALVRARPGKVARVVLPGERW